MKQLLSNNTWIRTIVAIGFFAGISWMTIQEVKPLQFAVQKHSEKIATLTAQFSAIDKQLDRIEKKLDRR